MAPLQWYSFVWFVLCSCLPTSQPKCGGRTVLTDLQGTIQDGPSKYPANTLCEWLIRGTWVSMLALRINLFDGFEEVVGNNEARVNPEYSCCVRVIHRSPFEDIFCIQHLVGKQTIHMFLATCTWQLMRHIVAETFVMKRWFWFYSPVFNRVKLKH